VVEAHFEYDAFGQVVAATGSPNDFKIRFSTKKNESESRLNYYGYRDYDPVLGRWLSRDPIEEQGGDNLYAFSCNNAIDNWDFLGLVLKEFKLEDLIITDRIREAKEFGPPRVNGKILAGITNTIWEKNSSDVR